MADEISIQDVYDDLVGVNEIAANLGVDKHRVRRWIERRAQTNCPEPVLRRTIGPLYSMSSWRGWFALWRVTRGSETWTRRADRDDSGRGLGLA